MKAHLSNPHVPSVEGHGWTRVDGSLEPLWYEGNMLPQLLVDECDSDDDDDNDDYYEISESDGIENEDEDGQCNNVLSLLQDSDSDDE